MKRNTHIEDINLMSQLKIKEDKSIMDCTVKNLEKTFDIKQKAMVNKLHNMQWLKNMSHSSNPEKLKTIYKHIQDHNENNKLKDEDLLTENIKTYSVKESDNYHLIDTYKKYLPIDAISENNDNVWNKDANSSNTFPNSTKLVKVKDEKNILMITKSILTAKLDVQSCTDKMQKNQSDMPQNNENITQNAVYSNVTNFETRSNKTADLTNQDKNINKDEVLQIMQQPIFKQSESKMPKSVKKNASNYGVYKKKTFEKSEKKTSVSKNSDLLLYESEKRNKKIVDDKHSLHHQKANLDFNFKRNTKFVMQYKNSTLTKPVQNKDILRNIECTSNGKNSSYNNSRFDNGHIDNTERKDVIKRECISSSVFSNSNVRIEGLCTKKDRTSQKNKLNHMQSTTDTKSTIVYKKGTCNSEKNVNFVNAKTHLIEKECTNLNIDIRRQKPMLEQYHKEMKRTDKSKPNIDQQNIEINNIIENEQTNSSKYLSNLLPNKCTIKIPTNMIHQHSLQFEDTQYMDDVKKLESNQTICNNSLEANTIQKNVTIVNSQQSIQNIHCDMQQAITQAKGQIKQMPSWDLNGSKFYNQNFSVRNAMRPSQVSNTFNVTSLCESNMQTSNDSNATSMLGTAINHNKENSNVFYKYMPNIQQKSDTFSTFTDHSILSDQTKCNSSVQDGFHVESYNMIQPTTIYNFDALDSDDIKNTRLSHPIIYAPSLNMQTQNPQLQYPLPVFYNSSCASYVRIIPNIINQSSNFDCISSLHDQQLKYIPRMQVNNYVRANDLNNHIVQPRNIVDNIPMKFNQHYEKCEDNSQIVCDPFRYVAPLPHSGSRQNVNLMPVTNTNQYNNAYFWQNQKRNQNAVNYMQISKCPKNQTIQDFSCDENESENIPPIISPKEFVTNNVKFSNNIDQFAIQSV